MENAGAVADMVTVAYNTGVIDAKENTNRLADLEKDRDRRIQHAGRVSKLAC